jgi:membrane protein CcdC involved in cytochrome C biogenesis
MMTEAIDRCHLTPTLHLNAVFCLLPRRISMYVTEKNTEKKLEKSPKGKRPYGTLFMFSRLMELNEFF